MLMRRPIFALGLLSLLALPQAPASAADAAAGHALAESWCSSCHLVAPDSTHTTSDAPPFPTLAAGRRKITASWLAFRLLAPHPAMPQVSLTRAQAADLAAYFATLRK
ncbi:cytochrome c [Xanthobacter autotrophicus DSM 431]|uniref:cytochrome c n=1 Tax=Xanthobacter nonsaccharivorans TaxID=3119912 RepID=UPI0037264316